MDFLVWAADEGEDFCDEEELDEVLCEYLHVLLDNGRGKSVAIKTLYGIIMLMPRFREGLPTAHAVVEGFARLHPSASYPPLTRQLASLLAVELRRFGHADKALAVLLAFEGLLRISEVVGLRVQDVADTRDARLGVAQEGMSLRLRRTKTGTNQFVSILNPLVVALLRLHIGGRSGDVPLFRFSVAQLRNSFKAVLASLGLHQGYVFHSLRHGRATELFLLGTRIEDILLLGRWASNKSARTYVQSGRALLLSIQVDPVVARRAWLAETFLQQHFLL